MARRSRIEYPGAFYHVLNRGNYRSWIFDTVGARKSFVTCLDQCCLAQGWRSHAWVLGPSSTVQSAVSRHRTAGKQD
ncbi:hypothetical protein QEH52_19180, partial [Coraliomargarita sp. SDUM461003]